MIEKLVNSKTRLKILKLFLSNIDDRYYLRELERLLDESLSPLRRQLLKLTSIGILMVEEEANLKYYRLNKNFEGLEELKKIVLGKDFVDTLSLQSNNDSLSTEPVRLRESPAATHGVGQGRFRYDVVLLSFISFFVLITAVFVVYANNKNIKQVAKLISKETVLDSAPAFSFHDRSNNISVEPRSAVSPASNGEMMSKKWKVIPGNIPVLSSGETGEEKNSKEL